MEITCLSAVSYVDALKALWWLGCTHVAGFARCPDAILDRMIVVRKSSCRAVACVALLAISVPSASMAATPSTPQAATLRLSNAPIRLEYPEPWRDWAVNLASFADVAAARIADLIGVSVPAGTIRWEPTASGPGSGADGVVEVRGEGREAVVVMHTNVPLLLQDFGAAHALGYARWLGAYVVGRVAMGAPGSDAPWWTEGAALYLTDRIYRDLKSTTPILYGIEANFTRAAQSRRPVDLSERTLTDAARGKAYATFKLLEGLYGADAVTSAIGQMVVRPSVDLAAIIDALGRQRQPDPDVVVRDWLKPTVTLDVGIDRVDLREGDTKLRARLLREVPFPVPVTVEARCADGQVVTDSVAAGMENASFELELPCLPTSVAVDPNGLIPDVNRSNNSHGFGDADKIRRFFAFDERFSVGEIQFSTAMTLDETQQRAEPFQLRITNRTDQATGVGVLVSAEWFHRPERVQRAYFVNMGPRETRLLDESLGYPNRGTGHARVEARFWEAGTVEDLTDKIVGRTPGAVNAYIVVRDAPEAPRRAQRGIYRRPPTITETSAVLSDAPEEQSTAAVTRFSTGIAESSNGSDVDGAGTASVDEASAEDAVFRVRIRSPAPGTLPIGDVELVADVVGSQSAERVEFYVNDRRVGSVEGEPFRIPWSFPDDEEVFVIRAVATGGELVSSDDVVLDRSTISFGATVNLVTVHATVRDAQGRLVRDLTPEDFRLTEDGSEQEIVQFDFGEVPVSAALSLDQSSSMMGGGVRAERAGGLRLVDALVSDINRAMILGFNDRVWLYADFTQDKEALAAALEAIDPDGSTALFDTLAESIRKLNRRTGKRALVVLSDGLDTNSTMAYADVLEFLRQSDVLVYTIGLQLMQDGTELGDASGAVKRGVEQLRAIADATGGAPYFPIALEELEEIYGLIADELNSQYALSYYPTNSRYDGNWRQLRVEIEGKPGVWVQVREGYYGVEPDAR